LSAETIDALEKEGAESLGSFLFKTLLFLGEKKLKNPTLKLEGQSCFISIDKYLVGADLLDL